MADSSDDTSGVTQRWKRPSACAAHGPGLI
jgi:hypothetical protein